MLNVFKRINPYFGGTRWDNLECLFDHEISSFAAIIEGSLLQ
jgi:hypothetical protein